MLAQICCCLCTRDASRSSTVYSAMLQSVILNSKVHKAVMFTERDVVNFCGVRVFEALAIQTRPRVSKTASELNGAFALSQLTVEASK